MKKILCSPLLPDNIRSLSINIAIVLTILVFSCCGYDFDDSSIQNRIFLALIGSVFLVLILGQIVGYFLDEYFKKHELTICIRTYLNPILFSYADVGKLFIFFEKEGDKVLICEVVEEVNYYQIKHLNKSNFKQWYDITDISIAAYSMHHVFKVTAFEQGFPYTQLIDSEKHYLYFP